MIPIFYARNSVQNAIYPVRKKATSELSNGVQLSKTKNPRGPQAHPTTLSSLYYHKHPITQEKFGFFLKEFASSP